MILRRYSGASTSLAHGARLATALGLATLASACGAGIAHPALFSTDWQDDGGASIARVWARVAGTAVPAPSDVVVGVTGDGSLVGLTLTTGSSRPWTFAHALDARPVVAGSVVLGSGGGEVFALDASDGHLLWKRSVPGFRIVGAGDDGSTTVATFERTGSNGASLLAVGHDGHLLQEIDSDKPLGTPATLAGFAFVPWAGEYVSVIDLSSGEETARVTVREQTGRVWAEAGSLWFGGLGFIRFDEHIRDSSKGGASTETLPALGLPGAPRLRDRMAPLPVVAGAEDRVRLYARPSPSPSGAATEDSRLYATYFRLAMGFDSSQGKLQWVHAQEADFLGGAAAKGGVVLCDEKGIVSQLDAGSGALVAKADLGTPLQACIVSMDTTTGAASGEGVPLVTQIENAVATPDPELMAVQKLLVRDLATADDESATRTLIDLADDPRTAPELGTAARAALSQRRNDVDDMLTALRRHYDYLKDVLRSPPVGPLADALAAMNEKSAAPLLADHLLDPQDSGDDVRRAAAALVTLAGPREIPALRRFFGLYRATADDDDVTAAVVNVAKALLALQDRQGMAEVKAATASPLTAPAVHDQLGALNDANAEPNADQGK